MKVHGKRFLLNPRGFHSTAAIVAELSDTSKWKTGCGFDGEKLRKSNLYDAQPDYVQLQISDCIRTVSFDIGWETAGDRKASLHKVDKMIEALSAFREGLVIEQRLYVERVKVLRD